MKNYNLFLSVILIAIITLIAAGSYFAFNDAEKWEANKVAHNDRAHRRQCSAAELPSECSDLLGFYS